MTRSFSMATLLLLVAIAAAGSASLRGAVDRMAGGNSEALVTPIVAGGLGGFVFGIALALWNRGGFLRSAAAVVGATLLGSAAGAQMIARVSWTALFVAPVILVTVIWLIAVNRRRSAAPAGESLEANGGS